MLAFEIALSIIVVLIPTAFFYSGLSGIPSFWSAQTAWSTALVICWLVVAAGYFHQGWLVRKKRDARDVSLVLPVAVFFVQCILFVKGIYYGDWSLIVGALVVNCGVVFSFLQIMRARKIRVQIR